MSGNSIPQLRNLIGVPECARWLGVSESEIYKLTSQRRVPFIKVGRLVRFDPVALEAWLKQHTVMPMPEKRA